MIKNFLFGDKTKEFVCNDDSPDAALAIFKAIKQYGLEEKTQSDILRYPYDSEYPCICYNGGLFVQARKIGDKVPLSLEDFINQIKLLNYTLPVKVQLNNEYEAEITATTIKVGCQDFPIEVLEKIVTAKKQYIANQKHIK